MRLLTVTKGQAGRWRATIKLFGVFLTLSNAQVRFRPYRDQICPEDAMNRIRLKLYRERGMKCECCGSDDPHDLELHHIEPVRFRPDRATDPDNLMILCRACHQDMHHMMRNLMPMPGHE